MRRTLLIAALLSAAAGPATACQLTVEGHGALKLIAFDWNEQRGAARLSDAAVLRLRTTEPARLRLRAPSLVAAPRAAYGRVRTEIKYAIGGWESDWSEDGFVGDVDQLEETILLFARVRPRQGDGLAAGSYRVAFDVDCAPK